jgi:hypothetical protein
MNIRARLICLVFLVTVLVLSIDRIRDVHPKCDSGSFVKQSQSNDNEQLQDPPDTVYFSNDRRPDVYETYCLKNDTCFDKVWPKIKQSLCPDMAPNTSFTDALFSLARDEIALRQWNATDTFLEDFYRRIPYGTGFVYKSPENKTFVYMAVWKAAHETVREWGNRRIKPLAGTYSLPHKAELQNILKKTENPCIVTAIRDPISHFLSGYNEIDTRVLEGEYTSKHARMRNAPKALFHRYHYGSKQRFEQFVADILSQPYTLGWNDFDLVEPLHFYSMSGILWLLSISGAKMTSFLPSIQNLNEEWPKFAYNACPDTIPENVTEPFHVVSSHSSSKDKFGIYKAAKDVWSEGGPTARAICVLQAMDYACWDDLPDGIPSLCRDVFSSKNFMERILKQ